VNATSPRSLGDPGGTDERVGEIRRRNADLEERVLQLGEELVQMKAQLHQAQARFAAVSPTDEATGLMTVRELQGRALVEIARAIRYERELSLVVIELDASPAPDAARLRAFAELCHARCRAGDLAAIGETGDIVVLLPETSLHGAMVMASRILSFDAAHAGGSARAGCASWPRHGRELASVLAAARRALHAAPEPGDGDLRGIAVG
jgi:PleD family two-component response regulator